MREVVGRRLRPLLGVVIGLVALLAVNSLYLLAVRLGGLATGRSLEGPVYLALFLGHLVLGLLLLLPALAFMGLHLSRALRHPNRRAVRAGLGLGAAALVLLASGVLLIRLEGVLELRNPTLRAVAWWAHVLTPLAVAWLFVLHRLAGPRLRWRSGRRWAVVAVLFTVLLVGWQGLTTRRPTEAVAPTGDEGSQFSPALARTASGGPIPADVLDNDEFCRECHPGIHERWLASVHHLSSFNNPPYRFSVNETRKMALQRDGNVDASRFCAGCHDPVPLFSGRFSDPAFDGEHDPTGGAGITCTSCHAITRINSPRGNADYTIAEPVSYPFERSHSAALRWVNRQLIKAKPELHKRTFLKPFHRTPEFCGTCHKVHLPESLNHYKWLRGQDHYDSYLLSGVSGHGVASFYYPKKAVTSCAGCHMPPRPSDDFAARDLDGSGRLAVHDHLFLGPNTAVARLAGMSDDKAGADDKAAFLRKAARVDLFALREGGAVDGRLLGPLRPELPVLEPGATYLLEVVIRTLGVGHHLTQGTADSNQLWLEVTASSGGRVIGTSGAVSADRRVDRWAHFVNAWVLDREGRRIDRRNPEDIFVPLYNHQIPPGAGAAVHYRLLVPPGAREPVELTVRLRYRKFDTTYMHHVFGPGYVNDLPVLELAADRVVLPVAGGPAVPEQAPPAPQWERVNDYGIGLLLTPGRGELRQAEAAFQRVEALGRPDGPVNLARVYLREGRVTDDAPAALARAVAFDPPARAWTVLWLGAQVKLENGDLDGAIADLEQILEGGFAQAAGRGFDFTADYRALDLLGDALYQRALRERGAAASPTRAAYLHRAEEAFRRALALDPENLGAHWGLRQIGAQLGDAAMVAEHGAAHARYRPDDNARDRAVAAARRADPAADHAADPVVIYDLAASGAAAE